MAGHNKWSKIKHKKAAEDAKKSKVFGKLSRLIAVESRKSGGDENSPGLKSAIEQAKRENMPKDNIKRAIKRGVEGTGGSEEKITYETYGPGGVAIVIEVLTDNKNRSSSEIKHILSKHGLELSQIGAATWAFKKEGSEWKPSSFVEVGKDESKKLKQIIDDLEENDDVQKVFHNRK